ncbi:MAG: VOC family protein [Hyphomicrobiales bacterium]|nr:VOC family protein [Hyphomicrobiales bacterium]
MRSRVRTCFILHGRAEEAARFYAATIPDSTFDGAFYPQEGKPALMAEFTLAGTPYQILGDGPPDRPNPSASISVTTKDQAETDRIWNALVEGGAPSRCSWLTDRYGVSWQIVPEILPRLIANKDRAAAGRAMQAMFSMSKIDIAALEKAFRGA